MLTKTSKRHFQLPIVDCQLKGGEEVLAPPFLQLGNWQLEIGNKTDG